MTDPTVTLGAGAVVVRDGTLLLVRQTYGWAEGRWLVPNGGQRPGESLAGCAVRELREETGLNGLPGRIVALRSLASPLGSDTFVAFSVNAPDGQPRPDGREVDAAAFFTFAAIDILAREGTIVRLHRLLAEHVLGRTPATTQTMPAKDRAGNPAQSTVYLL